MKITIKRLIRKPLLNFLRSLQRPQWLLLLRFLLLRYWSLLPHIHFRWNLRLLLCYILPWGKITEPHASLLLLFVLLRNRIDINIVIHINIDSYLWVITSFSISVYVALNVTLVVLWIIHMGLLVNCMRVWSSLATLFCLSSLLASLLSLLDFGESVFGSLIFIIFSFVAE